MEPSNFYELHYNIDGIIICRASKLKQRTLDISPQPIHGAEQPLINYLTTMFSFPILLPNISPPAVQDHSWNLCPSMRSHNLPQAVHAPSFTTWVTGSHSHIGLSKKGHPLQAKVIELALDPPHAQPTTSSNSLIVALKVQHLSTDYKAALDRMALPKDTSKGGGNFKEISLDQSTVSTNLQDLLLSTMFVYFTKRPPSTSSIKNWAMSKFQTKCGWQLRQVKLIGKIFFMVYFQLCYLLFNCAQSHALVHAQEICFHNYEEPGF